MSSSTQRYVFRGVVAGAALIAPIFRGGKVKGGKGKEKREK